MLRVEGDSAPLSCRDPSATQDCSSAPLWALPSAPPVSSAGLLTAVIPWVVGTGLLRSWLYGRPEWPGRKHLLITLGQGCRSLFLWEVTWSGWTAVYPLRMLLFVGKGVSSPLFASREPVNTSQVGELRPAPPATAAPRDDFVKSLLLPGLEVRKVFRPFFKLSLHGWMFSVCNTLWRN